MRRAKLSLACGVVVSVLIAMNMAPKGLLGRETALAQVSARAQVFACKSYSRKWEDLVDQFGCGGGHTQGG